MNWDNLFGTDTFTYGFDCLTQDEFCTAILVILGIICLCQISMLFYSKYTKDHTGDTADLLEENNDTLKDIKAQLHEITTIVNDIQIKQNSNKKDS